MRLYAASTARRATTVILLIIFSRMVLLSRHHAVSLDYQRGYLPFRKSLISFLPTFLRSADAHSPAMQSATVSFMLPIFTAASRYWRWWHEAHYSQPTWFMIFDCITQISGRIKHFHVADYASKIPCFSISPASLLGKENFHRWMISDLRKGLHLPRFRWLCGFHFHCRISRSIFW